MNAKPLRIVVAVSGGGRTLRNLWEKQNEFAYVIVGIICSRQYCPAREFASQINLPIFLDQFLDPTSSDRNERLSQWLIDLDADLIALAGFLRPFPTSLSWSKPIINIHPALLPAFGGSGMYGMNVHRAVAAAKLRETGVTIHLVTKEYDEGKILFQSKVPIDALMTADDIASRVFAAECTIYPQVIHEIACGKIPLLEGPLHFNASQKGK